MREAWNLSVYYVNYRYSAVIALGKLHRDHELDTDFCSAAIEHTGCVEQSGCDYVTETRD